MSGSAPSPHDQRICGLFQKIRLLSRTSETKVWEVVDDMGRRFVAKMTKTQENGEWHRSFTREYNVYFSLADGRIQYGRISNGITPRGFPNIVFAGRHSNDYDVIVIEFLFPDVFSFRHDRRWNEALDMSGYLRLAKDMLLAVQKLHWRALVHRNVKPRNFRMAAFSTPSLVNFSDAQHYMNSTTCEHYSAGHDAVFTGTPKYASLNAHRLKVQSRRDDLISLGYSIIDIIKKGLPWDSGSAGQQSTDHRNAHIQTMKETLPLMDLCDGLPGGIYQYMLTVTNLSFKEIPDYANLTELLQR